MQRIPSAFREHVILAGAEVNRFGGFRFQGPPWEIDVWLLEDTWANRKGHVEVKEFADLLEATFFNCDAVIYDPSSRKIVAKPSYFEDLYGRVLEVNLEPNPNPVGNAVRAFRYAAEKDFRWGPRLCRFISEVLEDAGSAETH